MTPLVRLSLLVPLIAVGTPLGSQSGGAGTGCVRFAPDPLLQALVREVQVSNADYAAAIVDFQKAESASVGEFLSKGGSLIVVDAHGNPLGVANRDTVDPSALYKGERLLKVTTPALGGIDRDSIASADDAQPSIKVGEAPTTWSSETEGLRYPKALDLQTIKRSQTNPNGLQIDSFDGVVAPAVQIGTFDGEPAPPSADSLRPTPSAPDPVAAAKSRSVAATVAIYFRDKSDPRKIESCNGVQVGPGLILTNLHCATRRHTGHVVHFGSLHLQPDPLLPGTPVSGDVRCPATVVSPDPGPGQRFDFALLRLSGVLPAPYRAAVIALDDGSGLLGSTDQPQADLLAMQVQYWMASAAGSASLQYEKYLMQPPNCAIKRDGGLTPKSSYFCNSNGIQPSDGIDASGVGHVCDAERGSSGSPIYDPAFGKLLALHRGGGRLIGTQNCAVPAGLIRTQLQAWGQL